MPVTNKPDGIVKHTEGGKTRWAANYMPAKLVPALAQTLTVTMTWPHLQTGFAYGHALGSGPGNVAATYITVVPQEWDSGRAQLTTLPAWCNYYRVDAHLARTFEPSGFMGSAATGDPGRPFPKMLVENNWATLDGGSALVEQVSSLRRLFRVERDGNTLFLRWKQSVNNGGWRFNWLSGNNPQGAGGQQLSGWTHGGHDLAAWGWPFFERATGTGGQVNRNQGGQLPTDDPTNFGTRWAGTLRITPGYLQT